MHPHPHVTPRDRRTERRRNAPLLMQRGERQGEYSDGPILSHQKLRRSRSWTVVVFVGTLTPVDTVSVSREVNEMAGFVECNSLGETIKPNNTQP
jgi:hypothetical protein